MSLRARLLQRVERDGPIPFDEFMRLALYDPDDGYFATGPLRSVKAGDAAPLAALLRQTAGTPLRRSVEPAADDAGTGVSCLAIPRSSLIGFVPAGEGGKEAQRRARGDCVNVISASQTVSCRQLCDDWRLEDAEPAFANTKSVA